MTCITYKYIFHFTIFVSFSRIHNISIPGELYCLRGRQVSCDLFKHYLPVNQLKQLPKAKHNVKFYRVLSVL